MAPKNTAANPGGDLTYHLKTPIAKRGARHFIAPLFLTVGSRERAKLFADTFLGDPRLIENEERGLMVYTGDYTGIKISIVTSLMGPAQMEITHVETIKSGGRIGIRVGSAGLIIKDAQPGEPIIIRAAMRFDGQEVIAPIQYPAFADHDVTTALVEAANLHIKGKYHCGIEATGNTFYFGQGRIDLLGRISPQAAYQYEQIKFYAHCMSMEAATMFVISSIYGLPAGAINIGYGNRLTDKWLDHEKVAPAELEAGKVALEALCAVAQKPRMAQFMNGKHILSVRSVEKASSLVGVKA